MLGKETRGLAGLGKITRRSLLNNGTLRSLNGRVSGYMLLKILRKVDQCTRVVQCPRGLLGENWFEDLSRDFF